MSSYNVFLSLEAEISKGAVSPHLTGLESYAARLRDFRIVPHCLVHPQRFEFPLRFMNRQPIVRWSCIRFLGSSPTSHASQ